MMAVCGDPAMSSEQDADRNRATLKKKKKDPPM